MFAEELVAEPLALVRAAHRARRCRGTAIVSWTTGVAPTVSATRSSRSSGTADDRDVRLERGERVVGRRGAGARERVEERRLARVRQADDADLHEQRLDRGAEQRAGHHVARVVHAQVGPRQGHRPGGRVQGRRRQHPRQRAGGRERGRRVRRGIGEPRDRRRERRQVRAQIGPRPAHDLLHGGVGDESGEHDPHRARELGGAVTARPDRRDPVPEQPLLPRPRVQPSGPLHSRRVAARAQQSQERARSTGGLEADPLLFGVDPYVYDLGQVDGDLRVDASPARTSDPRDPWTGPCAGRRRRSASRARAARGRPGSRCRFVWCRQPSMPFRGLD